MVYKPRKTVNGHKRDDRTTRRRKARDARKRRLAARPVRSNIKRYVAEQFGKTHPDNRYYLSFPPLKPTNKLDDTPRYYPFGATFQKAFLNMEFKRMKEVVSQTPALAPLIGAQNDVAVANTNLRIGDHNHWRSLLGRGIHMKHATVYGTISLHEQVPLRMQNILKYGNLKLHMFVLEDKAVTKTEFLNWYKEFLATKSDGAEPPTYSVITSPQDDDIHVSELNRDVTTSYTPDNGTYDADISFVPYVSGSKYVGSQKHVCGELTTGNVRPKSGFDEFLMDWKKFYQTNENTSGVTDNPERSLFYNEVKCTTDWDGTRANSLLPVNKSRFIVHEHKTWSFKPKANGCVDTVIPFEYSFPEHYMHYDKELLDMPFVWNTSTATERLDDRGISADWMYPRKQPFIVFVYTCDNPIMVDYPDRYHDIHYNNISKTATVRHPNEPDGAFDIRAGGHKDHPNETRVDDDVDVNDNVGHLDPAEQADGDIHMRTVIPNSRAANEHTVYENIHAETATVRSQEIFNIDMHFKCTY